MLTPHAAADMRNVSYNPMATLIYGENDYAIHRLFSRGTAGQLNFQSVLVMLLIYFFGASSIRVSRTELVQARCGRPAAPLQSGSWCPRC